VTATRPRTSRTFLLVGEAQAHIASDEEDRGDDR
jgi:hypothetical protein